MCFYSGTPRKQAFCLNTDVTFFPPNNPELTAVGRVSFSKNIIHFSIDQSLLMTIICSVDPGLKLL